MISTTGFGFGVGLGTTFSGPDGIVLDNDNDRALVVDKHRDAVFAVDIATGGRKIIAQLNSGQAIPNGIALDELHSSVLVTASGISGAIYTVDLFTGERTILSDAVTGTGAVFGAHHRGIALDIANNQALVVDSRSSGRLITLDISSGDRVEIVDGLGGSEGVALEGGRNRALIAAYGAIVSIDLSDGTKTVISDANTGGGTQFDSFLDGIVLDDNNNRVLVIDKGLKALFSVDLSTGDRKIISGRGTGTGTVFSGRTGGLTFDSVNNRVLLMDEIYKAMFAEDLVNGQRVMLSK